MVCLWVGLGSELIVSLPPQIARLDASLEETLASKESLAEQLAKVTDQLANLPKQDPDPSEAYPTPHSSPVVSKAEFPQPEPAQNDEADKAEQEALKVKIQEQGKLLKAEEARCASLDSQLKERSAHLRTLEKSVADLEKKKKGWEAELKQLREGKEGFERTLRQTQKELQAEEQKLERFEKLEAQTEQSKATLQE